MKNGEACVAKVADRTRADHRGGGSWSAWSKRSVANIGIVFPGQGSQYAGMGRDLFEDYSSARRLFQEADERLGFGLSRLCFEGPEEQLRQTVNAQPALLVTSLAAWAALGDEAGAPIAAAAFAGHSLGEYTALVAAGVLDFATALKLVRERGRLMQAAAEATPGGMMAVLGLADEAVEEVCRAVGSGGTVVVANYNAPGQIVISGEPSALEQAGVLAKGRGARRVVPLAVSGAFHSPLMAGASDGLRPRLESSSFRPSSDRIFSNVTGLCYASDAAIPGLLVQQVTSPVRWVSCVQGMADTGVDRVAEVGPGTVLAGLVKRIRPGTSVDSFGSSARAREFAAWLAGHPAEQ